MKSIEAIVETIGLILNEDDAAARKIDCEIALAFSLNDELAILELLRVLDDNSECDECMFSIIHAVETLDDEIYVTNIIRLLNDIFLMAPQWTATIFVRIINNEATRLILLQKILKLSSNEKALMRSVCERIKTKNSEIINRVNFVMSALNDD